MKHEKPTLIQPTDALSDAYIEWLDEFRTAGEPQPFGNSDVTEEGFRAFVQRLQDEARGVGLPEGYVPASTYWLVCRGRVLGTCNVRHRLTDALKDFGGHVGYYVRPSERGKGHGTLLLKLALKNARDLGILRVLVTCDSDNHSSIRVIEKNDGRLDSESYSPQFGRITRRYWIEVLDESPNNGAARI